MRGWRWRSSLPAAVAAAGAGRGGAGRGKRSWGDRSRDRGFLPCLGKTAPSRPPAGADSPGTGWLQVPGRTAVPAVPPGILPGAGALETQCTGPCILAVDSYHSTGTGWDTRRDRRDACSPLLMPPHAGAPAGQSMGSTRAPRVVFRAASLNMVSLEIKPLPHANPPNAAKPSNG